ncbi:Trichodiene synthase [Leucoagaricus sp. SymC.cos]|nr:Trichodiene synthase [Leucoagaricus sp. SymC.cos]
MDNAMEINIMGTISNFLKKCDIVYPRNIQVDEAFHKDCYADAARRGIDIELISESLEAGIGLVDTSYHHLEHRSTQIFIAVWSGLMTHLDYQYEVYADGLKEFSTRFINQQPQLYPVLDQVVDMSKEFKEHWGLLGANLLHGAQLDFLSSLVIDHSIRDIEIQNSGTLRFPQFTRRVSGIGRVYAFYAFPPDLGLKDWIQVYPDLVDYICFVNDLLSFYMEELTGNSANCVSMGAKSKGITKIEALKQLADLAADSYCRGSKLLQSHPRALDAFRSFCAGYVGSHAIGTRYKLAELGL